MGCITSAKKNHVEREIDNDIDPEIHSSYSGSRVSSPKTLLGGISQMGRRQAMGGISDLEAYCQKNSHSPFCIWASLLPGCALTAITLSLDPKP